MILTILDLYNNSKTWLLERANHLYNVYNNLPKGEIKNKFWVEDREWDEESK